MAAVAEGVAPTLKSSRRAERPTETPEMLLPNIMPRMGMKYCGAHQGCVRTTNSSV